MSNRVILISTSFSDIVKHSCDKKYAEIRILSIIGKTVIYFRVIKMYELIYIIATVS